jgi:hypothetical protein
MYKYFVNIYYLFNKMSHHMTISTSELRNLFKVVRISHELPDSAMLNSIDLSQ